MRERELKKGDRKQKWGGGDPYPHETAFAGFVCMQINMFIQGCAYRCVVMWVSVYTQVMCLYVHAWVHVLCIPMEEMCEVHTSLHTPFVEQDEVAQVN